MKEVKTQQRYQCDFCKKRSVKHVVALHEKRCFRNPNRFCDACQNTGKVKEDVDHGDYTHEVEVACPYCYKFSAQTLKEIEEREEKDKKVVTIVSLKVPF